MRDLFFSECRRFRNTALIYFTIHLLVQLYLQRSFNVMQMRYPVHIVLLVLAMLSALAFALVQFGTYRQPSRWLWLLHRPLPPARIFGAIALASAALLAFAVGLPALLAVAAVDVTGTQVVDSRHYAMVLQLVLLALMAWSAGSYVILNRSRSAIVVLLLPLLLFHLASAWVLVALSIPCLALLGYIAFTSFKPDRLAPPATLRALFAAALPLQLCAYFTLVWAGSMAFQNVQIIAGIHPLNVAQPPPGGFVEATRAKPGELLRMGLAASPDPRAAEWLRQLPQLEVRSMEGFTGQFPVRQQTSNLTTLEWQDKRRNIVWTFSHDEMRFVGRDRYTGAPRGVLGRGGIGDATPFPAVPVPRDDTTLMAAQQMYGFDEARGTLRQMIGVAAPETLLREPLRVGPHLYVPTSTRLMVFDPQPQASGALRLLYSVALPAPLAALDRIDIAALPAGALLSFTFGADMINGAPPTPQVILLSDGAGKTETVATRALAHDFPLLFEHHEWWISPVLHAVSNLPAALIDKGVPAELAPPPPWQPRPAGALLAALLAALLSAAGAWYWLRMAPRRAGWIGACLVLGLPALASLMVLRPRGRPAPP